MRFCSWTKRDAVKTNKQSQSPRTLEGVLGTSLNLLAFLGALNILNASTARELYKRTGKDLTLYKRLGRHVRPHHPLSIL